MIYKVKSRLKRFDKSSKNVLLNIILGFFIKGTSLIISLLTLPAYLRFFEDQSVLGVWFTMVAILSWILNFDLGVGNGLRNKLVDVLTRKDFESAKKYISSAYIVLSIIAVLVYTIGYFIFGYINWNTVFNISESFISKDILSNVVRIVFFGIILQFVLKLITSVLYAMQKSFLPNLLHLVSNSSLLIFLSYTSSYSPETNITMLAWANVFTVNIPLLITTFIVFSTKLKNCKPEISFVRKDCTHDVLKLGGVFFVSQIMSMILTSTNEYLISLFHDPKWVVEYQIYHKIFSFAGVFVGLIVTPIWSAITKAQSENNFKWIKKIYKLLVIGGICGFIAEFAIIFILQFALKIWLGDSMIIVNYFYAFIFAISGGLLIWSGFITVISNGLGRLNIQVLFLTIGAIIYIPLAYILSTLLNSYIAIVIANIISLLPYCIIQPIWLNRYINNRCNDDNSR